MCIIAYSPANTPIPSADRRKNMFTRNPDGAGFMFPDGGKVVIEKGFMTLDAMEKRLAELSETFDFTALPIVFHYRIGTHGGNTPNNTHPFPITRNRHALKSLNVTTDFAVAHNGIIHCVKPKKGYSDTQEYIVRRLAHIRPPFSRRILDTIGAETGSKFAFMYGDGQVQLVGAINMDMDDGCFYSNTSYLGWRDLYSHNASTWTGLLSRHQSINDWEDRKSLITLDEDIVVDRDGALHDGAEFCMDVYGRIYAYDEGGRTATYCPGAHLLVGGARRRNGVLDMTEYETDEDEDENGVSFDDLCANELPF